MATYDENKRFVADLLSASLLDDAVHWIRNNLSPEEVFDDDQLIEYVKESADVDDVYETSLHMCLQHALQRKCSLNRN